MITEEEIYNQISCDYNKRRKCDSLYIEENKKLKKRIQKAIDKIKSYEIEAYYDTGTSELIPTDSFKEDLLEILEGK